jgi:hypothetical protein
VKQRKIRVSFAKKTAHGCVDRYAGLTRGHTQSGPQDRDPTATVTRMRAGGDAAGERRRAAELWRASSISSQGLRFQARITKNDAGDKHDRSRPSGRTHGRCRRCAADGTAAPTPASSRRRFNTRGRKQTAPLTCSPPCEAPTRILDDCEAAVARIDGGDATLGFGG